MKNLLTRFYRIASCSQQTLSWERHEKYIAAAADFYGSDSINKFFIGHTITAVWVHCRGNGTFFFSLLEATKNFLFIFCVFHFYFLDEFFASIFFTNIAFSLRKQITEE